MKTFNTCDRCVCSYRRDSFWSKVGHVFLYGHWPKMMPTDGHR